MSKPNCWEFKSCGRGPGSARECPAAADRWATGAHSGRGAGRACWVVAGTFCGGVVQGDFAAKLSNCVECDFYRKVRREEGMGFQLTHSLLRLLQDEELFAGEAER